MINMLVIGGGRQIGRALAELIDTSKFNITILNRGVSSLLGNEFYKKKNIQYIRSERFLFIENNKLNYDVVIDTCTYDPIKYQMESNVWKNYQGKYVFISSSYVYDYNSICLTEDSKLIEDQINSENISQLYKYAINKIECERIALLNINDLLILRPGVMLSEYDHTNRIEKWIARVESGYFPSEDQKKWVTQLLSVEDFVNFMVSCVTNDAIGIFNAAGSSICLGSFMNLISNFTNQLDISNNLNQSNIIDFFEKKSEAIINSNKAEKFGLHITNSENLLNNILKNKCKKY